MKKSNLRKIAILTTLSSILLTSCANNKTAKDEEMQPIPVYADEITTEETEEMISNQTIAKIYEEYKQNTNEDVDIKDLVIKEFDKPSFIWNTKGENYIYDFRINGYDNQEFTYCDPGYHGEMYAVIVKHNEDYEPISALANIDNKIINVKVTFFDGDVIYEPSSNYIYIENPSKEDFDNIKNGEEYINSNNKEPLLSKEVKEYNLLYRKNN